MLPRRMCTMFASVCSSTDSNTNCRSICLARVKGVGSNFILFDMGVGVAFGRHTYVCAFLATGLLSLVGTSSIKASPLTFGRITCILTNVY